MADTKMWHSRDLLPPSSNLSSLERLPWVFLSRPGPRAKMIAHSFGLLPFPFMLFSIPLRRMSSRCNSNRKPFSYPKGQWETLFFSRDWSLSRYRSYTNFGKLFSYRTKCMRINSALEMGQNFAESMELLLIVRTRVCLALSKYDSTV